MTIAPFFSCQLVAKVLLPNDFCLKERYERFEVQFPQRRPFFVENADFFATDYNLVFARRIVDPEAGLRFTGRSSGWGFGAIVMNDVATGKNRDAGDALKGEDAMITVLQGFRDLSGQDRVGVLFTDRQ